MPFRRPRAEIFANKNGGFARSPRDVQLESLLHPPPRERAAHYTEDSVITMCAYRVDGHRVRAVVAGLALAALAAAPAAAQEKQPFKSVTFAVASAAGATSAATDPAAADPAEP